MTLIQAIKSLFIEFNPSLKQQTLTYQSMKNLKSKELFKLKQKIMIAQTIFSLLVLKDIFILAMLNQIAERNSDKVKLRRLRNFLEELSNRKLDNCKKAVVNLDPTYGNCASKCMTLLSELETFKKIHNSRLDEVKTLKQKLEVQTQKVASMKKMKGFNLSADKQKINTIMGIFDLLDTGQFAAAKVISKSKYPFIQDLIEYAAVKNMVISIQNHQHFSENEHYGAQYNTIRNLLVRYEDKVKEYERQVEEYLEMIERGAKEEWKGPQIISHLLFERLQSINQRQTMLLNQNRKFNGTFIEDDFQDEETLYSSSPKRQYNQCPQNIIDKLRKIALTLKSNTKAFNSTKSPEQCIKQIQEELNILKNPNPVSPLNQQENEYGAQMDKAIIDSLNERVSYLERLEQNSLLILKNVNEMIENMVRAPTKPVSELRDQDKIFTIIERNLKKVKKQQMQMQQDFQRELQRKEDIIKSIIKERDSYKNQLHQMNFIKGITEVREIQSLQYIQQDSASQEVLKSRISYLELQNEALQLKKNELQAKVHLINEQNTNLKQKIADDKEMMKSIKEERINHEKQNIKKDEIISNQLKKLKSFDHSQLSLKKSSISSKKQDSSVGEKLEEAFIKSASQNDCQICLSLRDKIKELNIKKIDLQEKDKKNTEFIDKMANQKAELSQNIEKLVTREKETALKMKQYKAKIDTQNQSEKRELKQNLELLTKQNSEATKKLNVYKRQLEDQNQQITTLNKMLNQMQQLNAEFENSRPKSPSSSVISKSSINTSTIYQTNLSEEIEQYKTKNKELKKRIGELESKNLKEMQFTMNAKKESQTIKKKHEQIKNVLLNVEIQLDQQKEQKEKLKRQYEKSKKQLEELKKQYEELKKQYEELKIAFDKKNSFKAVQKKQQQRLFQEFLKQPSSQHRCISHFFTARNVFQSDEPQRLHLINILQQQCGPIYQTKLLYHFDPLNKVNFHRYIDNKRHIVTIMKTEYSRIVAAYCQSYFSVNGTEFGNGLLMPLWDQESVFRIQKDKKANAYDDYYLLYGNSEIRIRSQQNRVFSNFGISNGYFDSQKKKVQDLLGENQREMNLITYEIYTVIFQRDRE